MSEQTEVSFDTALMMALHADAQKELNELPTPAQLKERYPDTSRWDARLQAALHKRSPVLKRVLIAALTLVILTLGALAVSADFRRAVYTMIQKFMPVEMQLTYQVDGEPSEQLPNGYSDHYVPDGFERDYEQGYDNEISFLHAYVDVNDKNIFYYVDCSVIQDYGQVETFDNEHTQSIYTNPEDVPMLLATADGVIDWAEFHLGFKDWTNYSNELYFNVSSDEPLDKIEGKAYVKSTSILNPEEYYSDSFEAKLYGSSNTGRQLSSGVDTKDATKVRVGFKSVWLMTISGDYCKFKNDSIIVEKE